MRAAAIEPVTSTGSEFHPGSDFEGEQSAIGHSVCGDPDVLIQSECVGRRGRRRTRIEEPADMISETLLRPVCPHADADVAASRRQNALSNSVPSPCQGSKVSLKVDRSALLL